MLDKRVLKCIHQRCNYLDRSPTVESAFNHLFKKDFICMRLQEKCRCRDSLIVLGRPGTVERLEAPLTELSKVSKHKYLPDEATASDEER